MTSTFTRNGLSLLAALAIAASAATASAAVRHEGDWGDDDDDPEISLDLDHTPRAEAVKRLADAAGWSIVFDGPPGDALDVHVKNVSATRVLDLLLANGDYVAHRDDKLISIRHEVTGGVATPPLPPPVPAAPTARGSDRVVTGSGLTVAKDETVHDVAVLGGSLDVYGTVTGDAVATGGSVNIHPGGRVIGDVKAMGGSIWIEDGASVTGDVESLGGSVHKGTRATIGGDLRENASSHGRHHAHDHKNKSKDRDRDRDESVTISRPERLASEARGAIVRTALLFVFGAVIIALLAPRMEELRVQIASRPMRTFATGILGVLGVIVALVALCVIIIGIPFAIIGALLVFFGTAAGIVSVLETVGCALLGHRTKNPYVHLAIGCVLFLLIGAIPFVGGFVKAFVVLTGLGAVVATRAGGLLRRRARLEESYA